MRSFSYTFFNLRGFWYRYIFLASVSASIRLFATHAYERNNPYYGVPTNQHIVYYHRQNIYILNILFFLSTINKQLCSLYRHP